MSSRESELVTRYPASPLQRIGARPWAGIAHRRDDGRIVGHRALSVSRPPSISRRQDPRRVFPWGVICYDFDIGAATINFALCLVFLVTAVKRIDAQRIGTMLVTVEHQLPATSAFLEDLHDQETLELLTHRQAPGGYRGCRPLDWQVVLSSNSFEGRQSTIPFLHGRSGKQGGLGEQSRPRPDQVGLQPLRQFVQEGKKAVGE